MNKVILLAVALLVFCGSAPHSARAEDLTGQPVVKDGDTFFIGEEEVRIFGIDAPETNQLCHKRKGKDARIPAEPVLCGLRAKEAMYYLVVGRDVFCTRKGKDQYGRTIATCRVGDKDIASAMVRSGNAIAYRYYSQDYVQQEDEARKEQRGIWALSFENPDAWRHRHRES